MQDLQKSSMIEDRLSDWIPRQPLCQLISIASLMNYSPYTAGAVRTWFSTFDDGGAIALTPDPWLDSGICCICGIGNVGDKALDGKGLRLTDGEKVFGDVGVRGDVVEVWRGGKAGSALPSAELDAFL